MVDFLAENNLCGQTLLRLVSRGNAIIAELLRLSDYIPPAFRDDRRPEHAKYAELLADFSYFSSSDYFENNIVSKLVGNNVLSCAVGLSFRVGMHSSIHYVFCFYHNVLLTFDARDFIVVKHIALTCKLSQYFPWLLPELSNMK
jgi:Hereditary spastic paraplegia protein strumpellin